MTSLINPPTIEQLASSNVRLAEACLALASSSQKLTKEFERTRELLDQTRRTLAVVVENREMDSHFLHQQLIQINTNIALSLDNIKDVRSDVTGQHKLMAVPVDEKPGMIVSVLDAFARMRWTTQVLLIILIFVVAAGGWLSTVLHSATP